MATYDKPRTSIILNGETESISSGVRNKTRVSTFFTLIQYDAKFLARAVKKEKKVKWIQIGKEEVKLSLFVYMILYLKDPKDCQKNYYI
jgi:hypothetical protein